MVFSQTIVRTLNAKAARPSLFGHLGPFSPWRLQEIQNHCLCVVERIFTIMYIKLIVCTKTNNLHWHSAMPYAEKANASKPAFYYLIFLIRCNIKLQYICFLKLFCCLPCSVFALFKWAPPSSFISNGSYLNILKLYILSVNQLVLKSAINMVL